MTLKWVEFPGKPSFHRLECSLATIKIWEFNTPKVLIEWPDDRDSQRLDKGWSSLEEAKAGALSWLIRHYSKTIDELVALQKLSERK